jgi:hypothetical protein
VPKLPAKIPQWTVVSVDWDDASSHSGAYVVSKFLATYKVVRRRTCGYVLRYDKNVIITAETDDRDTDIPDQECENITAIPMAMVRGIKVLK